MTKLVAVFGVLAVAVVSGQTPERPNFSGTWVLVADRSAPSTSRPLGQEFRITQSSTSVTVETTVTMMSGSRASADAPMVTTNSDVKVSTEYICDGVEHEQAPPVIPGLTMSTAPAGAIVSLPPPAYYRATWMTGQLIIFRHTNLPNENNALATVNRLALSLDTDGTLIVDSLGLSMRPRANGPKQDPPVSVRSVYKKAQ